MARITGGIACSVSYADDDDRDTPSVTIALSQDARSADPWILEIWCELRSGGRHLARRLTTSAPAIGADPARIVAVGRVPGARRWEVVATAARGAIADLQLVAAEDDGGCCGVRPANDAAELERLTFGPIVLAISPSPFGPPLRLPIGALTATLRGNYTPAAIGGAATIAVETSRDGVIWRPLASLAGATLAFVGPIATPPATALALVSWPLEIALPAGDRLVRWSAWETGVPATPGSLAVTMVSESW